MKSQLLNTKPSIWWFDENGTLRDDGALPPDLRGDVSDLHGNVSDIRGDVSDIQGNVSDIRGDVSRLWGNLDECEITPNDR